MIVLTGDRPTGSLHLGHWVGSLQARTQLQYIHDLWIIVADTQVLNGDFAKLPQIQSNIVSVVRDYLSVGIDPDRCTVFLQSQIPQLGELTNILSNLVNINEIMRLPTIRQESELYGSSSMGFLSYPISQTADIVLFGAELVPVGSDQMPIIHFANDLAQRSNTVFGTDFAYIQPQLSTKSRLLGLDGQNKMSKSLGNAIFLQDSAEDVWQKVRAMYTDANHLKISDPGNILGNVVFDHLDAFHMDKPHLQDLKNHYQRGGLGDMVLKKILYEDLLEFLQPIWLKSQNISDEYVLDVLAQGTAKAKVCAASAMDLIRDKVFCKK